MTCSTKSAKASSSERNLAQSAGRAEISPAILSGFRFSDQLKQALKAGVEALKVQSGGIQVYVLLGCRQTRSILCTTRPSSGVSPRMRPANSRKGEVIVLSRNA